MVGDSPRNKSSKFHPSISTRCEVDPRNPKSVRSYPALPYQRFVQVCEHFADHGLRETLIEWRMRKTIIV